MKRIISYDTEAREGIQAGVTKLKKAVGVTMGGKGRNVLIKNKNGSGHQITKDGVTVAKEVELNDPLENLGCEVVKKVALKTNDEVGDGTTTSIILAESMLTEGLALIEKGINPIALKRGMDIATEKVVEYLRENATKVEGDTDFIKQIAMVSSNNDEKIGSILAEAFEKVGKHGVIKLDQSKENTHSIKHSKGLGFDRGYIHPIFTGDINSDSVELDNPLILVTDYLIKDLSDFTFVEDKIPMFEDVKTANRPLLIICEDMEIFPAQALGKLLMQRAFVSVVVKAPEFGNRRTDALEDIAAVTGATFISAEKGLTLKDATFESLGGAKSVYVDANNTSITKGSGKQKEVNKRISLINKALQSETAEFAVNKLEERLAKLTGGVATIMLGASSELELDEIKDRVKDALNATKAAISEGVVVGGGIALYRAANILKEMETEDEDEKAGILVLAKALLSPFLQIVSNSGDLSQELIDTINDSKDMNLGYNVKTRKFINLFEGGIIDPVKVTITALQNSSSIVSTLLTTECVINTDIDEDSGDIQF